MKKILILLLSTFIYLQAYGQSVLITPEKSEFVQSDLAKPLKFKSSANAAAIFETTHSQTSRIDLFNGSGYQGSINWGYNKVSLNSFYLDLFTNNGKVEINENGFLGVNKTPQTAVDVTGEIRATSLQSAGMKPVFADQNGTLVKSPAKLYTSYGFGDFIPENSDVDMRYYSSEFAVSVYGGYANKIILPLHFPHGAKLKNCVAKAKDNSSSSDMQFAFSVLDKTTNTLSNSIKWDTDGSSGSYISFGITLNEPIDNSQKSYFIQIKAVEQDVYPRVDGFWYAGIMSIQQFFCEYTFE